MAGFNSIIPRRSLSHSHGYCHIWALHLALSVSGFNVSWFFCFFWRFLCVSTVSLFSFLGNTRHALHFYCFILATGYPGRCNSLPVEFWAPKKCVIHVSAEGKHLWRGEQQNTFEVDFNCVFMLGINLENSPKRGLEYSNSTRNSLLLYFIRWQGQR